MGKKKINDTSDYSVEFILLNFLWFEDHDSLGYWNGVPVWNSKTSKKALCHACISHMEMLHRMSLSQF